MEAEAQATTTALVVTRNCAATLRQCLTALETSQNCGTLEILVVDNGSADETPQVGDEFANVTVMRLPKNFGQTKALNIGLRTAKGEFVFLLQPTDLVGPNTISQLLGRLTSDDSVGAVCPSLQIAYDLPGHAELSSAWMTRALPQPKPVSNTGEFAVGYPGRAPLLVRRLFLKGMNYFDERYGDNWWDLELCWQLRSAGKKIVILPDVEMTTLQSHVPEPSNLDFADSAAGVAAYLAKHHGWGATLGFRVSSVLGALTKVNVPLAFALLSGRKIDGTQE